MKQKNILFLFTDQQRHDTIEALGNPIIRTPVLNRLVGKGVAFTRAYSNCPVCIPARYALHTGQLPNRTDCVINERMPAGHNSFMEILTANGYQSHGVGKMHFNLEGQRAETLWGFESRDISEEGGPRDDYKTFLEQNGYAHVHDPLGVRSEMYYIPQPSQLPERLHNTAWVADRSIEFLKRRDPRRPFLLMSSFIKPHPPFESPTPWNKLYRGPEMPLPKNPPNAEQLLTYWNHFQNRYKYRDQGTDTHLLRCMKAAYYGMISLIDYQIGRLIGYMNDAGLLDNTLIIYASDHGELLGDYGCVGKRSFLDSAARIPMIMVHPDLPGNVRCGAPVSLVDMMPTFLQAAGIPYAGNYSGDSLADIATGAINREHVIGQYHRDAHGVYMLVTEKYKYIYSAPDRKEILFDLTADAEETVNRANNPMYKPVANRMKNQLIAHFQREGYTAPLDGDDWRAFAPSVVPEDPEALLLFQDPPASLPNISGYERDVQIDQSDIFRVGF